MTKEKADYFVQKYETFYRKEININDTDLYLYNYILSDYDAFQEDPLSRELRGLVIIKETQEVFLSVPKFFNYNEIPETLEQNTKHLKIKKVQKKLDGSLITPVVINSEIITKSKASFESDQAKLAQEIIDNDPELSFAILDCYSNGFQPFFELIGNDNRHVIDYNQDNKLVLIMMRDHNGEFIDINKFDYLFSDIAESYDYNLEELIHLQQTAKGIEGFVTKFTNNQIMKFKTKEFFELHKIVQESDSYKIILERVLDENMDDILSQVPENRRENLRKIMKALSNYVVSFVIEIEGIIKKEKKKTRKEIALKYRNHLYFGVIMEALTKDNTKEALIRTIKNRHKKEKTAESFIKVLI